MLSVSEWSYLGGELDDASRGAAVGIQIRVIDRHTPAGAAAALQSRRGGLGDIHHDHGGQDHERDRTEAAAPLPWVSAYAWTPPH